MGGSRGRAPIGLRSDLAHSYFTHSLSIGARCSRLPCAAEPASQLAIRPSPVLQVQMLSVRGEVQNPVACHVI